MLMPVVGDDVIGIYDDEDDEAIWAVRDDEVADVTEPGT